jgi:hypothetical protein
VVRPSTCAHACAEAGTGQGQLFFDTYRRVSCLLEDDSWYAGPRIGERAKAAGRAMRAA